MSGRAPPKFILKLPLNSLHQSTDNHTPRGIVSEPRDTSRNSTDPSNSVSSACPTPRDNADGSLKSYNNTSQSSVNASNAIVPCLTTWDKVISRTTTILVALAYAYFWVWFCWALVKSGTVVNAVFSFLGFLMLMDQIFHIWVMWMIPRMSKLQVRMKTSQFRIAMVVTKAPSEPMELLCTTLLCMLNQDYIGHYDVWIADEKPTAEMQAWCAENGVRISSRDGIDAYHKKDWPRRTKCKEGNLAYFYDMYGYDMYDVVYQFDSDHAPEPNYISSSIAGFYNAEVGYMAFPSINGHNRSWIGRARTWLEAYYYGPYQASFSFYDGKWAMPNCTGSHYAVRTSALKAIGGLGPELDEDLSTTMMFASRGFKGIYSMDTIALGHGPETFEAAMIQERQWSRSATILHFRWRKVVHPTYKHFTLALWIRACTTMFWYLSQMAWLLWFMVGAIIGYYTNWCTNADEACNFSVMNFMLRSAPSMLLSFGHEMWCRRRRWLRIGRLEDKSPPMIAPTIWMYRILRIVWMSLGVFAGFQELIFKKSSHFRVTPKGSNHVAVLSVRTLQPLLLIYLVLGAGFWIQFIWEEPSEMGVPIYLYSCAAGTVLFLIFIIGMHYWENGFASAENTVGHVLLLTFCIGTLVVTSVFQAHLLFSAAAGNMFVPNFIFPYEMIVMCSVYGVASIYVFLITFLV